MKIFDIILKIILIHGTMLSYFLFLVSLDNPEVNSKLIFLLLIIVTLIIKNCTNYEDWYKYTGTEFIDKYLKSKCEDK